MKNSERKSSSMNIPPGAVKIGLLWALLPLTIDLTAALMKRPGSDAQMQNMAVAAGIVFATSVLSYSMGFAAGRADAEKKPTGDL